MNIHIDQLSVEISPSRNLLGKKAAEYVSDRIKDCLSKKEEVRIVFAAAPSQDEFLEALSSGRSIDWARINAFHMDEYIGLPPQASQLFSNYLNLHLFSKVKFKKINYLKSDAAVPADECRRYADLINEKPIDIVCMGIGENGHLAFNDPPVADFSDRETVKVVELDHDCRQQQVNDGCFPTIDNVPTHAITLTIPALLAAKHISVAVPGIRKADAVHRTIYDAISTECPATILRTHQSSHLFLDYQSGSKLQVIKKS